MASWSTIRRLVFSLESSRGEPDGIATLDSTGNVPVEQLANAGGGGAGETFGPTPAPLLGETDGTPLLHEWVIEDLADESSWWGAVLVHFVEWTPTISGPVELSAPLWDGTVVPSATGHYEIFEGTLPEAPSRDGTQQSGNRVADSLWTYDAIDGAILQPSGFDVVAGQPYVLAMWVSQGVDAVGLTGSLTEWALSIQPFGGSPQLFPWREASGDLSVASGYRTEASGSRSIAGGLECVASASDAEAYGRRVTASGVGSFAAGEGAVASGMAAAAFGRQTVASGARSLAAGSYAIASGDASVATGNGGVASGDYSRVHGSGCRALGLGSVAEGQQTRAEGSPSIATGENSLARNSYDWAHGSAGTGANRLGSSQVVRHVGDGQTFSADPLGIGGWNLGDDCVAAISGLVAARSVDGATGAAWRFEGAARCVAGALTILGTGTVTPLGADAGAAGWDVTGLVEISAGHLGVEVVGAAEEIHWSISCDTQEVR